MVASTGKCRTQISVCSFFVRVCWLPRQASPLVHGLAFVLSLAMDDDWLSEQALVDEHTIVLSLFECDDLPRKASAVHGQAFALSLSEYNNCLDRQGLLHVQVPTMVTLTGKQIGTWASVRSSLVRGWWLPRQAGVSRRASVYYLLI